MAQGPTKPVLTQPITRRLSHRRGDQNRKRTFHFYGYSLPRAAITYRALPWTRWDETEMKDPSAPALHTRRSALGIGATSGVGLVSAGNFIATDRAEAAPSETNASGPAGQLRSAGAMTFGPENVLFVADIAGAAVHAFALQQRDLTPQTSVALGNFHNFEGVDLVRGLDAKLAALMGTTYDNIIVNDMAVHQPTQQIFLSVERGRGPGVIPAIVKVNH